MRFLPPDESGESEPESDDPGGGGSAVPSLLSRTLCRLTGACRAARRTVRAGVVALLDAPSGPPVDRSDRRHERGGDGSTAPAQYDLVSTDDDSDDPADSGSDADSGSESLPPVVSTREPAETTAVADELDGPDRDRPALEVQWHGDAVTLVSAEEPDGRITSDVWEEVKR